MNILSADHFSSLAEQNIHQFCEKREAGVIGAELERIASQIGYTYTVVHGARMSNESESLLEIGRAFNMPSATNPAHSLSWDGASDYLGELQWPSLRPQSDGRVAR